MDDWVCSRGCGMSFADHCAESCETIAALRAERDELRDRAKTHEWIVWAEARRQGVCT